MSPAPQPDVLRRKATLAGLVAVTGGGLTLGSTAIAGLGLDLRPTAILACGVTTALLCAPLSLMPGWLPRRRHLLIGIVLFAVPAAVLNSPASFLTATMVEHAHEAFGDPVLHSHIIDTDGPISALGGALAALLMGLLWAVPLGLLFGLVFMLPLEAVRRAHESPSIEDTDRAGLVTGAWLEAVGLVCFLFARADPGHGLSEHSPVLLLPTVAGGLLFATMSLRMLLRRRWIRRVRSGLEAHWCIAHSSRLPAGVSGLCPMMPLGDGAPDILARRRAHPGGDAYRTMTQLIPWALLPAAAEGH